MRAVRLKDLDVYLHHSCSDGALGNNAWSAVVITGVNIAHNGPTGRRNPAAVVHVGG